MDIQRSARASARAFRPRARLSPLNRWGGVVIALSLREEEGRTRPAIAPPWRSLADARARFRPGHGKTGPFSAVALGTAFADPFGPDRHVSFGSARQPRQRRWQWQRGRTAQPPTLHHITRRLHRGLLTGVVYAHHTHPLASNSHFAPILIPMFLAASNFFVCDTRVKVFERGGSAPLPSLSQYAISSDGVPIVSTMAARV